MRPLFKKATLDSLNPTNYCPVSYLPFLVKVTEKLPAEQPQVFLDGTFQSSFCPTNGMVAALVTFTDDLQKQLEQGDLALLF